MFGKAPSDYFGIDDQYFNLSIDFACMLAHLEDENYHYKKSQEAAQNEAGSIEQVLERFKEESQGRG